MVMPQEPIFDPLRDPKKFALEVLPWFLTPSRSPHFKAVF
jgi:hypothetical protein